MPTLPYSRRDILRSLATGAAALTLAPSLQADSLTQLPDGFGRAKRCLLLYIYGAWSQLDTFDPKPLAPEEIRGEFSAIDTSLPGVQVCEHLPLTAQMLDRCTIVRSMSHPWNIHSASYTLTGNPDTARIEGWQRHPDQWPYLGSLVDYLGEQGELPDAQPGLPRNVMLPWRQSLHARPNKRSGTFGGFLGTAYDPLWTEFRGEAPYGDPFRGVTPQGRFVFGKDDASKSNLEDVHRRHKLLSDFESQSSGLDPTPATRGYERHSSAAFRLLSNGDLNRALQIDLEPTTLREAYGMTLFGQACLTARRLLEADVKIVTVVWDEFGQTDESWDTHYDHHSRMKGYLLPGFDQAFSTLIRDLDSRGLLEDTLVMSLSEHGRTPRFFSTSMGAPGRDHWSRAYSQIFAGAGVPRGRVIGATDEIAGEVTDHPIDPKDILCTACHLLGIDSKQEIFASPGRPAPLVAGGEVISELLG